MLDRMRDSLDTLGHDAVANRMGLLGHAYLLGLRGATWEITQGNSSISRWDSHSWHGDSVDTGTWGLYLRRF